MAVRHRTEARATDNSGWHRARWPEVRPEKVVVAYDRLPLDTLYVTFGDPAVPGYYLSIAHDEEPYDGVYVKISEDNSAVIGIMIEGYLVGAHSRWPSWLNVAEAAGISNDVLDAFGLTPPAPAVERNTAISTFVEELRGAWETATR